MIQCRNAARMFGKLAVCMRCDCSVTLAFSVFYGIAVDSARGLLYFTDWYLGVISEMRTDGTKMRNVFNNPAAYPNALAVDSANRLATYRGPSAQHCSS